MSIDRVNIHTEGFSFRASNIRGGQLQNVLNELRSSARLVAAASPTGGASDAGAPAMQSPAERFPDVAQSGAGDSTNGFAPGGSDSMRSLDTNSVMRLIVRMLEQLMQAITQLLQQTGGGQGCGAADQSGSASPSGSDGFDGGGSAAGSLASGSSDPSVDPYGSQSGAGATTGNAPASGPPRNPVSESGASCGASRARRARAQPHKKSSMLRKIMRALGRGAAAAAPLVVPGGPAVRIGIGIGRKAIEGHQAHRGSGLSSVAPRSLSPSLGAGGSSASSAGGSLEDRLFAFMSGNVRDSERELDGALQAAQGGANGDSRTLATQKVQQLAQKRSEAVEALTNLMRSMHESTKAVAENLRA